MPRKRLRPKFATRNFSYHCRIIGDVPQAVWDTARAMQTLWNRLVEMHAAVLDSFTAETSKADKKAAYENFWRQAYETVKLEGEALGLSCWPKWHIHDAFKAAQQRFARHQGGAPKKHYGLRRIIIPHRTESGGVPLDWLWRDSDRKHTYINPERMADGLPSDRFAPYRRDWPTLHPGLGGYHGARGYFTIGRTRIPLDVTYHRPLPQTAIIKRIALCGQFEPAFKTQSKNGWEWSLMISFEMPPPAALSDHGGRGAGLDLGWRVREDGLRIGVLYDGQAFRELYLPFDLANRSLRKLQQRFADHLQPCEATTDARRLWELQAIQDGWLERCKDELLKLDRDEWPAEARQMMSGIVKMRAGGLRRLSRQLRVAGIECSPLIEWEPRHAELARRMRAAQVRWKASRNTIYRNLAREIAERFDALAWEGDLGLKEMAEDESAEHAIINAQRYRQMASLHTLRQYIRESMKHSGRQLFDRKAAYSTRTCAICGGYIEPSAKLILECENGHREDQDYNSARLLWSELPEELRAVTGFGASVPRSQVQRAIREVSA